MSEYRSEAKVARPNDIGEISVNGETRAVAVNDAVVPRSDWPARPVKPGDRIEVLTAVQGG